MQGSRSPSLTSGERAAQGGCAPNKLHPPRGLVGNGDRIERSPLLGAIRWGLASRAAISLFMRPGTVLWSYGS
jgi:hypothetical protein